MRAFVLRDDSVRAHFIKWLAGQPLDKPLSVKVEPWRKPRTNTANARLWVLHTKAAEVVGTSPERMHEDCCCDYFGSVEVKMPSGRIERKPNRTTTTPDVLPTDKFNLFMTWVEQRYIDMLGVWLDQ